MPLLQLRQQPGSKTPSLLADLERMTMLMAQGCLWFPRRFVSPTPAFEQLQHQHQAQQGLEVIRWFTTEIDSLRATISARTGTRFSPGSSASN